MNFLGMGSIEIMVILLVAFIVLGSKGMMEAARMLGKAIREVRRMTEGLPQIMTDDEEPSQASEWSRTVAGTSSRHRTPVKPGLPSAGSVAFRSDEDSKAVVPSSDENDGNEPDSVVQSESGAQSERDIPTDVPVEFKRDDGPGLSNPSSEENGSDETESVVSPDRDTK